jgi:hypothetical protein
MLRLDEYKEHNKKTFIFIKCKYKQKKGCMKRLYVARAAVQLGNDIPVYDKNTWYHIKTVNEIDYRWRFHNNYIYEVVAGVFQNKSIALKYAKSIYVTLLYKMLKSQIPLRDAGCNTYASRFYDPSVDKSLEEFTENENFFYWSPMYIGGSTGVGVYEEEKSIDDFDNYEFMFATLSISSPNKRLDFENVNEYTFTYCKQAQELLSSVILAESAFNTGMKMTIHCGLLEHISEGGKKDACVITKIDELIENIRDSELLDDYKNQIINYLREGKEISANQKCKKVIAKYAKDKYGPFTANQVFDAAYRCRSAFSHGEGRNAKKVERIAYMKYLVLDVIKGYMLDMEKTEP